MSSTPSKRCKVTWSGRLEKSLSRMPEFIQRKLLAWAKVVEEVGILRSRKFAGLHDEPLKGKRTGQRSVRLNRSYRAIYVERHSSEVEIIEVLEITKHEY